MTLPDLPEPPLERAITGHKMWQFVRIFVFLSKRGDEGALRSELERVVGATPGVPAFRKLLTEMCQRGYLTVRVSKYEARSPNRYYAHPLSVHLRGSLTYEGWLAKWEGWTKWHETQSR